MSSLKTELHSASSRLNRRGKAPSLVGYSLLQSLFLAAFLSSYSVCAIADEVVIDFESAEITGRWIESWEEDGVVFAPAHAPKRSKAKARLMFFPHISSGRKGILSAMANDPIPVRVRFPSGAGTVTLVLWGSTGCRAEMIAFDSDGDAIGAASVDAVPGRKRPGDPIPLVELKVDGKNIAYIEFSGPRVGEYLALGAIRFVPLPKNAK